jgi:Uma2 family endonuclease
MATVQEPTVANCSPSPELLLHLAPDCQMNARQFFEFCQLNRDHQFERTAEGDIIVMSPSSGSSSHGNLKLAFEFEQWARRDATGLVFDSSGCFVLPNQSIRAPDISWVLQERLDALTDEQWNQFLPLCPDFVLELRSPSGRLSTLQEKMAEYIENGARLGWLLDPSSKTIHIYCPGKAPEVIANAEAISGEPVLKGFQLDLVPVWSAIRRRR